MLGETADGTLVHIELQSTNEAGMAIRMLEHATAIHGQLGVFRISWCSSGAPAAPDAGHRKRPAPGIFMQNNGYSRSGWRTVNGEQGGGGQYSCGSGEAEERGRLSNGFFFVLLPLSLNDALLLCGN